MSRDAATERLTGKLIGLGLLLLTTWLLAMIWLTPISFVLERTPLPPTVSITPLEGNLFRGQLQLTTPQATIKQLDYRLVPSALLRGAVAMDIQAYVTGGSLNGRLSLNRHRDLTLNIHEARLLADAPLIVNQAPLPLSGVLVLEPSRVTASEQGLRQAETVFYWEQAGLQFENPVSLGRIDGTIRIEDGQIQGEIRDNGEGSLIVALTLSGGRSAQLVGRIQPRADAPSWLGQSLAMIGRPDPQGAILIRQTFPLPLAD